MRILIRFIRPSEISVQIVKSKPNRQIPKSIPTTNSNTIPNSSNTKYVITSLITSGLLAISETLPFLPNKTNGILDSFIEIVTQRVNTDK